MTKVHVGAGYVYLTPSVLTDPNGWLNIEDRDSGAILASSNKGRAKDLSASDDDYYKKFKDVTSGELGKGPKIVDGPSVCDAYGLANQIPASDGSADIVLARQVFEHLSIREAKEALVEFWRVLRPGGILRLDVPDHDGTVAKIRSGGDPFWARHLLGSKKNNGAYHVMSYTSDKLRELVESHGFEFVNQEQNIHFYPAFCLRFAKPPLDRKHWEYALANIEFPIDWRCADVGCGPDEYWTRANVFVDVGLSRLPTFPPSWPAECKIGTIYSLPFNGKELDYVLVSHVFEHLEDPTKAARELARVAKRGCIVCPTPYKDALFCFHERDHLWDVHRTQSGLRFLRRDQKLIDRIANSEVADIMHRLFRLGPPNQGYDSLRARKWFSKTEPELDLVLHWEGAPTVEVVG